MVFVQISIKQNDIHPHHNYGVLLLPSSSTTHAAIDYSQWRIVQFNWAGRIFNSTADILAWFKANNNTSAGFKIREMATPREKMFSTYEVRNRTTSRGRVPGATLYEPHGKRYVLELCSPMPWRMLCSAQHNVPNFSHAAADGL